MSATTSTQAYDMAPPAQAAPSRRPSNWQSKREASQMTIKKVIPHALRGHLVAASGEFIGTFFFLYLAYAAHLMVVTEAPSQGPNGGASSDTVVYVSLIYGLSLLVNAWTFYRISGGLFNPAIVLGLTLSGKLGIVRASFSVVAELCAAMCAGGLANAMFDGNINSVNTILNPTTSIVQGLFIEMLLTAMFTFVVLMLAAEKSKSTFIAPVGIGLALFVAELAGVKSTGGSLNLARSFGCALAGKSFVPYFWIYVVGPFLGAGLAASYYHIVKYARYEEANPDQESAGPEDSPV